VLALAGSVGDSNADRLSLGGEATIATSSLDYDQRIALAKRMVGQDPKQVAQVVKSWVAEDGS
jgi:flagellar M-ring protein FliF